MSILSKAKYHCHVKLFRLVHSNRPLRACFGKMIPVPEVTDEVSSPAMIRAMKNIGKFASSYPVNLLLWNGKIHLWPLFRFYLTLLGSYYASKKLKNGKVYRPFPSYKWRRYMIDEENVKTVETIEPAGKCDFLVFSALRSISWIEQDGNIHDRLMDPLIERLQEYGKVQKISMVNGSGRLDRNFDYPPEFVLFPIKYMQNNSYDVDEYDTFCTSFRARFPEYKLFQGDIDYLLDVFVMQYNAYRQLLSKYSPKAVFFFPADYHVALILAAKSLGIRAIDVQHGNMIGFYPQYNNWKEEPESGYDLLPDNILVWSEREKDHIKKTWRRVEPVVFGYPWLEKGDQNALTFATYENFCKRHKCVVVVSLSYHRVLPEIIEDIVNDPRQNEYGVGFVIKRNLKRFETAIPSHPHIYSSSTVDRASFSSVLPAAHLHITEESACLYEADQAGLNTFLIGKNWEKHFAELVDAGRVLTIDNANEFYANLERAIDSCSWPRLINNNSSEFDEFMRREFPRQEAKEEIPVTPAM